MESTISRRNLGKYDFIVISHIIDEVIDGEQVIRPNGQNQYKKICEAREDANLLFHPDDLTSQALHSFFPYQEKGFY